ncbi:MAG: PhzF family phenazine biosynthesis protein [Allorhizobium sp.]
MQQVAFVTVDVFTDQRFGGNPLAVIPDARGLTDEQMQQIATEFNYSESTFVLPPADPANTARVRIFTPTTEVPFAGHPNVGTAFVLAAQPDIFGRAVTDRLRFEEDAGLVDVELTWDDDTIVSAAIAAPRPLEIGSRIDPAVIASCTGLNVEDVSSAIHPPQFLSVGLKFAFAELTGLEALGRASPDTAAFGQAAERYHHEGRDFSLFVYVRLPDPGCLRARMFAPLDNVAEDPATGSASAALAAFLVSMQPQADTETALHITQGVEMGRASDIHLSVSKTDGIVRKVQVAGRCVKVMHGLLEY